MPDDQRPSPSDRVPRRPRATEHRTAEARAADHATIDRLAEDFVPALIAKLSASGLGEIEVAEGAWTVRVRRPGDGVPAHGRRATDRPSRSQPGHAGHGHPPAGFEGYRGAREAMKATPAATHVSSNGSGPAPTGAVGDPPAGGGSGATDGDPDPHRAVATSPAVGVFQPRSDMTPGTRVRNGDRLGAVDMLGIAQEVLAPADGILGASLVEAGQAVEYGQDLILIELAGRAADRSEA